MKTPRKIWINTTVVIDIASGEVLEREGFWHDGPVACMKQGKTSMQKTAEGQTTGDIATQNADLAQQKNLTGKAQGTLDQFEGPVQDSPFYKALLTTGIEGTSRAYDTARSNQRARANMSGFGYTQPVAQGGENQLQAQETSDLAKVPRDAALGTAPLALQAAGQTGSMGMGYGNQALGWGKQAQDWNTDAYKMNQARRNYGMDALQGGMQAALALV